ncbi:MAG TPA: hypothetical protein VGM92_11875 [Candidatus Kapabacteria bacterium]
MLPIVLLLALAGVSGCVWAPNSTEVSYPGNPYSFETGFLVHRISQRSIAGTESVQTVVSPYYSAYPDSTLYLIVNGDTAYRHPILLFPPSYDSSAPYRVDGSANIVQLVYPSFSISDTSYDQEFSAQITAPAYGDTIYRAKGVLIGVTVMPGSTSGYGNSFVELTDSNYFYSQSLDYEFNTTASFPSNELETFTGNIAWADLHFTEISEDYPIYPNSYSFRREVDVDRIVAYPLH